MQLKDYLGVPLEPQQPEIVAHDWKGEPIYKGEWVYETPDETFLLADNVDRNIEPFIEHMYGKTYRIGEE